ncbi:hypothetical protein HYPBUDRAFT_174760 [Hyphopichia burtonii NRRL Y-1933]|uniref:Uncharacterized protein n=1 Tax=Hyphopichia burtonii NRRL Y-1933 TaxID=984485 RepID=A0A1E4RRD5_9ASCO|nr:hypothetical protein HYPBUDRAFT_174760 [Hyphopichia burtonii NRRL Y-1933]ODV69843.1 hypothetical protein HYPBUDRAFT_174760 [Hyphopichia burtonii NRRL Y-1933]
MAGSRTTATDFGSFGSLSFVQLTARNDVLCYLLVQFERDTDCKPRTRLGKCPVMSAGVSLLRIE